MAWVPAAVAAGGSVLGGMAGKGSKHDNDPMNPEDMYGFGAQSGVRNLNNQIGNLSPQQYYEGSTVAGMNPWLSQSLGDMAGWGQPGGMGNAAMNAGYFAGHGALETGVRGGVTMMDQLRNQPGGPFQYNQGVYDQTMGNLMPSLQGAYDAASRDNNRQLNWNTLPGLNMGAAGAGQQGSTKLGQGSALATGMTMDRNADIGASLYTNAVNQANNNAMSAGTANLGANLDMVRQYGDMSQFGGNLMNQAFNQGVTNNNAGVTAGQYQQGYDQSVTDADVARWNFNQQQPYDFIKNSGDLYNQFRGSGARPGQAGGSNVASGAINGAQGALGLYGAGRDAGWWGTPTPPQQTWGMPAQNNNELRPFDTSGYGAMYR